VWRFAEREDIEGLIEASIKYFHEEGTGIYTIDPDYLRFRFDVAITTQKHNLAAGVLFIVEQQGKILGYSWVEHTGNNFWSQEKLCEVKLAYIDFNLPARTRVKIAAQMIDKCMRWATASDMDLLVSVTSRVEQGAFMRLHSEYGFVVRGNSAYLRLKNV
jgi:hypothetical protein